MLAKGPPWTIAAVFSVVCTRLGCIASFKSTVIAPAIPRSLTVSGLSSYVYPKRILPIRRLRSSRSVARHRIAIISDAGVMSKPLSAGSPLAEPPRPVTMLRRLLSLTSSTRFHLTSLSARPVFLL